MHSEGPCNQQGWGRDFLFLLLSFQYFLVSGICRSCTTTKRGPIGRLGERSEQCLSLDDGKLEERTLKNVVGIYSSVRKNTERLRSCRFIYMSATDDDDSWMLLYERCWSSSPL